MRKPGQRDIHRGSECSRLQEVPHAGTKRAKRVRLASSVGIACLLGILLLWAGPADAEAKKTRSRTETKSYDAPSTAIALGFLYAANCNPPGLEDTDGCVRFDLRPSDRLISFKIQDATGNPIYATVWDASTNLSIATFCGETEKGIPNPGSDFVYVEFPINASGDECFPSTATQGTVTATFSLRRQR